MKSFVMGLVLGLSAAVCSGADTSQSLTLATYNIHSGIPKGFNSVNYFAGAGDMRNIADVLTSTGANIVALQEVRNLWPAKGQFKDKVVAPDMALSLASLLEKNYAFGSSLDVTRTAFPENREYLQWGSPDQWTNNGAPHGEYGNAVLADYPITTPTILKLPLGDEKAGNSGDEPRIALRVKFDEVSPLGPVVIYSTHFQHNNGKTRQAQMAALLEAAKGDAETATVFLMGDFNHTPHPGEPNLLGMVKDAGFHDLALDYAVATKTKPAATMGESIIKIRIDYIFCSKPLKVTDVKVLDTDVSDHFPLAVTVEKP